jgi:23S rRNA (adenine2503-C2)-methyltransferase
MPDSSAAQDIAGLELRELEERLRDEGVEPFRARQLYRWIFKRGVSDFEEMTDLSKVLRSRLGALFVVSSPRVAAKERSADGTQKFLLELRTAGASSRSSYLTHPIRHSASRPRSAVPCTAPSA